MFHFHKWSKWEHFTAIDVQRNGKIIGYAIIQKRTCVKCGFTQWNKQQINANRWDD